MSTKRFKLGTVPVFLARLTMRETGAAVVPSQVTSASYSISQVSYYSDFPSETALAYHTNRAIPATAFLETVTRDSHWTTDTTGYNFKFTPDVTSQNPFNVSGKYRIEFNISISPGNPVRWIRTFEIYDD